MSTRLGNFEQDYISNNYNEQWGLLVSYMCSDRVINVLKWIQVVYKSLKQDGCWILAIYSSFEKNVIPITFK